MPERPCVLIVEARFYEDVADSLVEGAAQVLEAAGFDHERLEVPGVFEIPGAIGMALRSMEFHCGNSSRALMDLTTEFSVPLGFGVLTCEDMDQAKVRADPNRKNKGGEAAQACLRMMDVKRHFRLSQR